MTMKHGFRAAVAAAMATMWLAGCGLAETTAVAATEAEAAAKAAEEGKQAQEKIQRDIEAANKAAAEVREKAEQDAGQ
jgi:hypothetical protein